MELDGAAPLTIGRRRGHTLELVGDERVSRDHAQLSFNPEEGDDGSWCILDTGSKHGTWVNGVRLESGRSTPVTPGDQIIITPWAFRLVDREATGRATTHVRTVDDVTTMGGNVSRIEVAEGAAMAQHRLALLLDCAATISAADDEIELSEAVLDAATSGVGFSNAALLRPMATDGDIEVVSHRGDILKDEANPRLSRSLIRKAAEGAPARMMGTGTVGDQAHSIMQLHIEEALCVPIFVGGSIAGFLYLDNRDRSAGSRVADATSFAIGLAKLTAMAMANLKRLDLEQRYARIEAELAAGAEAQRWVLPPSEGTYGRLHYTGISRPGRLVGGDFFDVLRLDENRIAIALGDVAGKGVAASVLMTASAGYLHAALLEHGDPGRAVWALNRFVHPRRPGSRFLTLWVGVFDLEKHELSYVDAGHGHAVISDATGKSDMLTAGGGALVGIEPDSSYEVASTDLTEGGRVLIVSDGLVEQPGEGGEAKLDLFGIERVRSFLEEAKGDDAIDGLFKVVEEHAGTAQLADDATAILVRW